MPPEMDPNHFLCNEDCSVEDVGKEDKNVQIWFSHVLPQLRNRSLDFCVPFQNINSLMIGCGMEEN